MLKACIWKGLRGRGKEASLHFQRCLASSQTPLPTHTFWGKQMLAR